jgi:alkylation response protein AidB-like acyl-CoA dehydrogenase
MSITFDNALLESGERRALRSAVAALGRRFGHDYFAAAVREGRQTDALWREAGALGYLGVNLPERYGGGGAGMYELSIVLEELSAAGCGLLMMVVSPAICGTIIARFGTPEQQQDWLPRLASGSAIMAFAITEPDAGSNSHRLATVARRDGDDWVLKGRKIYISGVDDADAIMVVGRTADAQTGRLRPALFAVPTDAPGLSYEPIGMELVSPERQFMVYLDDVRLPASALIGEPGAALLQLFAGLNPERIMASAMAVGMGRHALDKAVGYARERTVWDVPIGAHQGIAHPLAQIKIELELARLMMQKAATL